MKKILILGAGLSSSSLIRYLLQHSQEFNWKILVTDKDPELVQKKLNGHPNGVTMHFDALNAAERQQHISEVDLVISMLPARFHPEVAKDCIAFRKNLITPSYVSAEMKQLADSVKNAGITIMNEIGVDPGIDHMSAMKIIDEVREAGGELLSFRSFCGGLIAPESDDNAWNYKFTWNPRNVVMAGSGGMAQYIDRGQYKYIPYQQLFSRLDTMTLGGYGDFEGYANRDSLSYRETYGISHIPTMYRGTLRRPGYCSNWNVFVQLGMTDDTAIIEHSEQISARAFLNMFLPYDITHSVEEKMKLFCNRYGVESLERFESLNLFSDSYMPGIPNATAAQLLEKILVDHWQLNPGDKDMLVMAHQFEYEIGGRRFYRESSMVNIGEDQVYTSMSNTVGLPMAICAKMILNGTLTDKGVLVPTKKNIYGPILEELEELGIAFREMEKEL